MAKLTDLQKESIQKAANAYILKQEGAVSQVAFANLVGIDKTYINQILLGKTSIGKTQINDKYYMAIANYLQLSMNKVTWTHFNTANFKAIINKFNAARAKKERCGIDGKSGLGKTYACTMYKKRYPANTYVVKCNATDNAKEFVQAIANEIGISDVGTKGKLIKRICEHLINLGNDPFLIIDEAENLKKNSVAIDVIKVIADLLEGRVAFAIVGLGIRKILLNGSNRKRQGFMQTERRFSFGWIECFDMTSDHITDVCTTLGITNKSALNWICQHVKDYDSLKRVCTDAIEESEKSGCEINATLLNSLFVETIRYRA